MAETEVKTFKEELTELLNKHSKDNDTNTPDFILAGLITDFLESLERVIKARDQWHRVDEDLGETDG